MNNQQTSWKFLVILGLLCLPIFAAQYYNKPIKTIPAGHLWVFKEDELSNILVQHLKSLGSNVPDGKISIEGLENHYDFINNQRVELIIREK